MKKRQVQLIIASMALALLGVIGFQLFWINHAITVKNEQFTQQVQDALQAVVIKLERQEAMHIVTRKLKEQEITAPAIHTTDKQENTSTSNKPVDAKPAFTASKATKPSRKKKTLAVHAEQHKLKNRAQPGNGTNFSFSWNSSIPGGNSYQYLNDASDTQLFISDMNELSATDFGLDSLIEHIHNELWQNTLDMQMPKMDILLLLPNIMQHTFGGNTPESFLETEEHDEQHGKTKKRIGICTDEHIHTTCLQTGLTPNLKLTYTVPDAFYNQRQAALLLQQKIWETTRKFNFSNQDMTRWKVRHDSLMQIFSWQSTPRFNIAITDRIKSNQNYTLADSASKVKNDLKKNFEKVQHKSEIVGDVFRELVRKEQPVTERVNQKTLDSLLSIEIKTRHIDIPYHFGIVSGQKSKVVLASTGSAAIQLPDNVYKAALFPTDVFNTQDKLFVYFPTQQEFIMGKMWTVFTSSGVLILVILSCFYVAIATILKQKKLSDVKNDFINNMTHEFKTPISTISLACEVLQDDAVNKSPAHMNRYLHIIQDENKRLGLQVEKVLQAAMLDRGELKLKITQVDIHEVIDQVLQNIGVQIEKRAGKVELNLEAAQTQIEADEVHLTNIIHNLLDNANKYSPEAPEITICTRSLPSGISLSITDKGVGMGKEALNRIFDRFYRIPTGNVHNVKGFGLGLSYVKTILQGHNGKIRVDSQPNIGSTFEIFLPYRQNQ